MDNFKVGNFDS